MGEGMDQDDRRIRTDRRRFGLTDEFRLTDAGLGEIEKLRIDREYSDTRDKKKR